MRQTAEEEMRNVGQSGPGQAGSGRSRRKLQPRSGAEDKYFPVLQRLRIKTHNKAVNDGARQGA